MNHYRRFVQAGLVLTALSAVAVVRNETVQVKVLESETHSVVLDDSGVPKNCDVVNFDAYCHNSITTLVTHTLLVQEGNKPPFRVSCRVDTVWSRCAALTKGATFDAKREKRGISVYVLDNKGRLRQQLYSYVREKPRSDASETRLAAAASVEEDQVRRPGPASVTIVPEERVKCSFTSTPSGAEISVDGQYVGSTPSVVNLGIGDHAVEVSRAGFAPWKRNLTLSAGSVVTVNAVLQESQ